MCGLSVESKISVSGLELCLSCSVGNDFDEEYDDDDEHGEDVIVSFLKLLGKYNKSFSGLFEIRLTKELNGRWNINIRENMNKCSEEARGYV